MKMLSSAPRRKVVSAVLDDPARWLTAVYWYCTLICGHKVHTSNLGKSEPKRVRCWKCARATGVGE